MTALLSSFLTTSPFQFRKSHSREPVRFVGCFYYVYQRSQFNRSEWINGKKLVVTPGRYIRFNRTVVVLTLFIATVYLISDSSRNRRFYSSVFLVR